MKKIIVEEEGEGLMSLLGEIVYETGSWDKKDYVDSQKLPTDKLYVQIGHIESFGRLK